MAVITTERKGHVFLIGLNEPDKLNSFSLEMLHKLAQVYTEYEDDPDLRCALLFAHGANFTSGLRLNEVGPAVAAGKSLFPPDLVDPLDLFGRTRTKPVVTVVKGYCFTIGIELLLASDIAIAARDTDFTQMEVQRGIMPFGGATLRFTARCGWGNAMRWMMTGERFDAEEALRIGLVQEVVAQPLQFSRGFALAESIAKQAPLAVQAVRRSAVMAAREGPIVARDQLLAETHRLMQTDDAAEGVASFMERREAVFKGK